MSLKGKVALVTGGSRGIGRAVCLELARQGADVAVNYAGNEAAAQETAQACRELGVRAVVLRADVADAAACDAMVAQVLEQLGRLDILVNNAGITRDGPDAADARGRLGRGAGHQPKGGLPLYAGRL